MPDDRFEQKCRLFDAAAELTGQERSTFLRRECGNDAVLLQEVEEWLACDARASSILDRTLSELVAIVSDRVDSEPFPFETCGEYRLIRRLGFGGMGEVFLAERIDNGNQVAIKVLRPDFIAVSEFEKRFELEKLALGRLQHPSIARFLHSGVEGGEADRGRPWFAMDYIAGQPIDHYCDAHKLPLRARLQLMMELCEAVRDAHAKLVVHCDLTPNNILITDDGKPHLVDFGIAKYLSETPSDVGVTTGARPYNVEYASPEQVRGEPLGTATDVYSLGAVLYKLLSGVSPFGGKRQSALRVIEDRILEQEPPGPSVVARQSGAIFDLASPREWQELDDLCLWALRKEADRRCALNELADDIGRFLRTEPLKARPSSLTYNAGKFVRRNRWTLALALAAALTLVAVVFSYNRWLAQERDIARDESARRSRTIEFVKNLVKGGDQEFGPAKDVRVIDILDHGVKELDSLTSEPLVRADIAETLGTVFQQLGAPDRAEPLLAGALAARKSAPGRQARLVAQSLGALSSLRFDQSKYPESELLAREALDILRRQSPPGDPAVGTAMAQVGRVLEQRGQYPEARKLLEEAVRILKAAGNSPDDLAEAWSSLARVHFDLGEYKTSNDMMVTAIAVDRQHHGDNHPSVANDWIYLAFGQELLGQYAEAETGLRKALNIRRGWYGPNSPLTASSQSFLAQCLNHQRKFQEAEGLLRSAIATLTTAYGEVHGDVSTALGELGYALEGQGRFEEGIPLEIRALSIDQKLFGADHQRIGVHLTNVGKAYLGARKFAQGELYLRQSAGLFMRIGMPNSVDACAARIHLSHALTSQGRSREAEAPALEAFEILSKQSPKSEYWFNKARAQLVEVYNRQGRPAKASAFQRELPQ